MSSGANDILSWLRAAAEPTRLRLLALCAAGDLSVSDFASAVAQSEPSVSRHLKILAEAGLVERLPQGQWVHYRLARDSAGAGFALGLLGQVDRADPLFGGDRERLRAAAADGSAPWTSAGASRLGRELREFIEADSPPEGHSSVLLVGAEHPELVEAAAGMSERCTVIAHSRRAAQSVRALAQRNRLPCRVILAAGTEALGPRDLARLEGPADAVLLDHLAVPASSLERLLAAASRALAPGGRLWLFERYDSLEAPRGRVVEHPIARLRRLLAEARLRCERMSPIEADGQHVLAASAAPEAGSTSRNEAARAS
jgi:DNA-binding transcriptional ArsR family regulator